MPARIPRFPLVVLSSRVYNIQADTMTIPAYTLVDAGTDLLWQQFGDWIRTLEWTADDNQMLAVLPSMASTRAVFAQKDEDGSFLACLVWIEYDEFAWIGNYICVPELRGLGVGSKVWNRALERIEATGKNYVLALRGEPAMAPKYAARDTPFELSRMNSNIMSCAEMRETCDSLKPTSTAVLKSSLTNEQIEELYEFDTKMTGRDRRDLLVPFLASPSFECAVLLNEEGRISAWAGITSTLFEQDHLFKLGPVYSNSLAEFASLTKALIPFAERASADAKIVVHIITGSVGERELEPLLKNPQNNERVTLFSRKMEWTARKEQCYVAHSCSAHFDA